MGITTSFIIKVVLHNSFPSIDTKESWNRICEKIERIRPPIRCSSVCWIRPQKGMVKINTDDSFFSNDKRAGIGGIVRHDNGNIIIAFSIPVQCNNNNHAVDNGIKWCINHGYNNLQIELDSFVIANMLRNKLTNNIKIKHIVDRITNFLTGTNHHFLTVLEKPIKWRISWLKMPLQVEIVPSITLFKNSQERQGDYFNSINGNSLRLEEDLRNVIFFVS
uniref:RNase H family protein n=1 Tax=Solanum tuberosum TaxID=4113 RepID=M1B6I5_SOLTU